MADPFATLNPVQTGQVKSSANGGMPQNQVPSPHNGQSFTNSAPSNPFNDPFASMPGIPSGQNNTMTNAVGFPAMAGPPDGYGSQPMQIQPSQPFDLGSQQLHANTGQNYAMQGRVNFSPNEQQYASIQSPSTNLNHGAAQFPTSAEHAGQVSNVNSFNGSNSFEFDPFATNAMPNGTTGPKQTEGHPATFGTNSASPNVFEEFSNANTSMHLPVHDTAAIEATYDSEEDDFADMFSGQNIVNPDDMATVEGSQRWSELGSPREDEKLTAITSPKNEYIATFSRGQKLGVLMERVDTWRDGDEIRAESAVVKLVVEDGAADEAGVTTGSIVVGINGRDMRKLLYSEVLNLIKTAPRPLEMRFRRVTEQRDTTQGHVLARISGGTFSVGNLTSGNARWTPKYFAFGGSRMDVLQFFVSRAAYHEVNFLARTYNIKNF